MTSEEVPIPRANRPGARSARVAACIASSPGPLVYTGTTAVPRFSAGAHAAARASGVNPSAAFASPVQASVYPSSGSSSSHSRCASRVHAVERDGYPVADSPGDRAGVGSMSGESTSEVLHRCAMIVAWSNRCTCPWARRSLRHRSARPRRPVRSVADRRADEAGSPQGYRGCPAGAGRAAQSPPTPPDQERTTLGSQLGETESDEPASALPSAVCPHSRSAWDIRHDARLLIVNCDDLGFCHAANEVSTSPSRVDLRQARA